MLMFWGGLREAAKRRQDKKSIISSPNDCFFAKIKNKNGILFRKQQKNIYKKEEKNIQKISKHF